jgi:hypothetical protein
MDRIVRAKPRPAYPDLALSTYLRVVRGSSPVRFATSA